MRLRALAPAKVNLCLLMGERRDDDRHELVTLFQSLSLADSLRLETRGAGERDEVICPGVSGDNLAVRALAALRARGWDGPPLRLTIDKRIPVAGGMAGGSADAAAALRLAMAVAPGRPEELDLVAASLGSDVPSQLVAGVSVGTGAGDLVERFEPLAKHAYVVLPAGFELSTAAVYQEADRLGLGRGSSELRERYEALVGSLGPPARIPDGLAVNDLGAAAISLRPEIGERLDLLLGAGAEHALVSGSGPTVFGLRWGEDAFEWASKTADELQATVPGAVAVVPVDAGFEVPQVCTSSRVGRGVYHRRFR